MLIDSKEIIQKRKRGTTVEIMFLFSYALYIVQRFIVNSALRDVVPFWFRRGSKISIIALLVMSLIINRKISRQALKKTLIVISIGLVVSLVSDYANMICIILLLIIAQFVEFNRIIKSCIYTNIIMIMFVVAMCLAGKLPNYAYRHYSLIQKMRVTVYSYGFLHYSTPSYIIFFISILLLYYKRGKIASFLSLGINLLSYFIFTTKLPFILSFIFIFMLNLLGDTKLVNKTKKSVSKIFSFLPLLLLGTTLFLSRMYNSTNVWMLTLNKILSDRLYQGKVGLSKFGIGLFGKQFEMVGVYSLDSEALSLEDYIYIDSDYLYMLIRYGIIFTLLIIIIYIVMLKKFMDNRYYYFISWTITCLLFALSNWCLYVIEFNPLIFAGMKLFTGGMILDNPDYGKDIHRIRNNKWIYRNYTNISSGV